MVENIVNSALYNKYTGIIKKIELIKVDNFKEFKLVRSKVTDRNKYDKKYLFDGVGTGCSIDFNTALYSSMGEAIERYCANIVPENLKLASEEELALENLPFYELNKFITYSDELLEQEGFPFKKATRVDKMYWKDSFNYLTGEDCYVPASLVYVNFTDHRFNFPNLSGIASGINVDKAVQSALMEVIERDASIKWWYFDSKERLIKKEIDGDYTFLSYQIDAIVPTVATFIYDNIRKLVAVGFSTKFDIEDAMVKAKAEAVQIHYNMLNLIDGNISDNDPVKAYLKSDNMNRYYMDDFRTDKMDMFDLIHNLQYYLDPRAFDLLKYRLTEIVEEPIFEGIYTDLNSLINYFKIKNQKVIVSVVTSNDIKEIGWEAVRVLVPGFFINAPTAYLPIDFKKIAGRLPLPHS